jgi:hypothetical protein
MREARTVMIAHRSGGAKGPNPGVFPSRPSARTIGVAGVRISR